MTFKYDKKILWLFIAFLFLQCTWALDRANTFMDSSYLWREEYILLKNREGLSFPLFMRDAHLHFFEQGTSFPDKKRYTFFVFKNGCGLRLIGLEEKKEMTPRTDILEENMYEVVCDK